ncbi:hypothetical protein LOC68_16190 [Blastopirellula sp. JC732]|uniref:Uncharacterized protein n=1 Tax=Blastopirellula sediminis TaxID=2894196 RepID=A0A9X1MQ22_9BACT|nr:hypothetical protein [Blastopirellula sediminis]MCC9606771.1 hypothetical protein [Blastopirellula sediminis]MCC9629932.1 hypothetical protein [Blastopirellula sediminis]
MSRPKKKSPPPAELSPYMLPTCDPPQAHPKVMRFLLVLMAGWLLFLVAMASDKL